MFVEPITIDFCGYNIWEIPPNGQGIIALMALNILKQTNLHTLEHASVEYYHLLIESLRCGFAEAQAGVVSCPEANDINYAVQ